MSPRHVPHHLPLFYALWSVYVVSSLALDPLLTYASATFVSAAQGHCGHVVDLGDAMYSCLYPLLLPTHHRLRPGLVSTLLRQSSVCVTRRWTPHLAADDVSSSSCASRISARRLFVRRPWGKAGVHRGKARLMLVRGESYRKADGMGQRGEREVGCI